MSSHPSVIDLFCGAGGLSVGLQRAGFAVVRAYDHWEPAVATYRANLAHDTRQAVIRADLDLPPADVIVGGPPCQGFSSAGMRREHDDRNTLITVFAPGRAH